MSNKIEYLVEALRLRRKEKGLSQRALSDKLGTPQSHISNVENCRVDLKTSSLIEFARVLDLELMLVPRALTNMVHRLIAQDSSGEDDMQAPPAYRLDEGRDNDKS